MFAECNRHGGGDVSALANKLGLSLVFHLQQYYTFSKFLSKNVLWQAGKMQHYESYDLSFFLYQTSALVPCGGVGCGGCL